jgi:hypothetical protein
MDLGQLLARNLCTLGFLDNRILYFAAALSTFVECREIFDAGPLD